VREDQGRQPTEGVENVYFPHQFHFYERKLYFHFWLNTGVSFTQLFVAASAQAARLKLNSKMQVELSVKMLKQYNKSGNQPIETTHWNNVKNAIFQDDTALEKKSH